MPITDDDPGDEDDREVAGIEAWTMRQMIRLGFSFADASELATLGISWHDAQPLIATGCPHKLARRLLLPLG